MDVRDLIATVFRSYGFEIDDGSSKDRYILATKGSVNLAIGYRLGGEVVGKKELLGFIGLSTNDDAHRHIFITEGGLDSEAEDMAEQGDIEIWDSEKFQKEVGRAIITEFGRREIAPPGSRPALPGGTNGEGVPPAGSEGARKLSNFERLLLGSSIHVVGAPGEEGAPLAGEGVEGLNPPEDEAPPLPAGMESKIMSIHLSRPDAQDLAKKIEGHRFDLQLIPYFIFDYTCEVTVEGEGESQHNSGTLGINALTLRHEQWPSSYETVEELDIPHTKLDFRFGYNEARSTVDSAVITLNTKVVETVEEKESATVIERKKVRPKEDALEVSTRGVVYLPVWCIEGRNGVMIIDAASGNILKEETFKSRDTVIL